ncbi:hypothetical protein HDU87_002888 [Geranomyces variabilis]|uniref:ribonuclease H n=1 Tax=Geranomyces variabilis TaxID=109894 RepID=A0AAD5TLX6_9FUNG|nr:hypothetical protein HDU87_002888 [Geranomyces variabilis]
MGGERHSGLKWGCCNVRYSWRSRNPRVIHSGCKRTCPNAGVLTIQVNADGCCLNNGRPEARGGVGVYFWDNFPYNVAKSLPNSPYQVHTNQRAEITAAITAIQQCRQACFHTITDDVFTGDIGSFRGPRIDIELYMDSKYVVDAMEDWRHTWKANGWRTSKRERVTNMDLFLELDELVDDLEESNVVVKFEHVPREQNLEADALSRQGASQV